VKPLANLIDVKPSRATDSVDRHPDALSTPTNGIRVVRVLSAVVVASIAAWSSYWHMVHVALRYGERSEVAYVLPLSVDGVLTVAAVVMAEDRRAHQSVRPVAKVAFLIGLSASIAANVAAAQPTLGGRLIAAWPAVALLLIVEMLVFTRPEAEPRLTGERPPDVRPVERTPAAEASAVSPGADSTSEVPPKFQAEPHRNDRPEPHRTTGTTRRRRPTSHTRRLAAEIIAAEPDVTRDEIAARIGISSRRLRTVLAQDNEEPVDALQAERS
jgi:hypothetical protein